MPQVGTSESLLLGCTVLATITSCERAGGFWFFWSWKIHLWESQEENKIMQQERAPPHWRSPIRAPRHARGLMRKRDEETEKNKRQEDSGRKKAGDHKLVRLD
jgi:hypothetical protein